MTQMLHRMVFLDTNKATIWLDWRTDTLPEIQELLAEIRHYFPDKEEKLPEMTGENWSNAWKRLSYLRLNLQFEPLNRQIFIPDEKALKLLGETISKSYSRTLLSE